MKREKTIHNIALNKLRADFKHLCFISTAWRTHNSGFKKLAVQCLNEALSPPEADSVVADSLVLLNRPLIIDVNPCWPPYQT